MDVKILPESFPFPMDEGPESVNAIQHQSNKRPSVIPYPAVEENISKLKEYLVNRFKQSVFTKSKPFKSMSCKPAHIHTPALEGGDQSSFR